jgi:hypothetical protein
MSNFFKNFPKAGYITDSDVNIIYDIYKHARSNIHFSQDRYGYNFYDILDGERPDQVSYILYGDTQYYWTFFMVNDHLLEGMHGWPMSSVVLNDYIIAKYPAHVLTGYDETNSGLTQDHFIWNKGFEVGEEIVGAQTGAIGTILKIDLIMNRFVLTGMTGSFNDIENIVGQTTGSILTQYPGIQNFSLEKEYNGAHHYGKDGEEFTRLNFTTGETATGTHILETTNREYESTLNDDKMKLRYIKPAYIEDYAQQFKDLMDR